MLITPVFGVAVRGLTEQCQMLAARFFMQIVLTAVSLRDCMLLTFLGRVFAARNPAAKCRSLVDIALLVVNNSSQVIKQSCIMEVTID
jgi:hypothetical protein